MFGLLVIRLREFSANGSLLVENKLGRTLKNMFRLRILSYLLEYPKPRHLILVQVYTMILEQESKREQEIELIEKRELVKCITVC